MPRAYSTDLRERALAACEAGEGRQSEIARAYRIGERTLSGWLKLAREEGRRSPKPRRGGTRPVGGEAGTLAAPVAERNDATLAEYADRLAERAAQPLGAVPGAEGARPGAEEKTVKAAEQDREDVAEARAAWRAELAGVDPARLVFIDETGIDTRMTRAYARAARGQRATGKVPWGRWERLTVIGALALDGVVASRGIAAATGTAVFLAFTEEVLVPALRGRPDALVVMDNLGAHKAEKVREALGRAGLAHRYLPSYSPDLNPIEPAWSKLKTCLRAVGARSKEALEAALGPALAAITAQDARGWFRLAGYPAAD
jgi:transposase